MATIQAAMERAKAQRAAAQPKNIDTLTPEQQQAAAEIDARRTAAGLTDTPAAAASDKTD